MEARALVARNFGEPAAIETIAVPDPGPGEVRVRVVASGVCGSDSHVLHGPSTAVRVPTVMGHEGAGVIESVGPDVDDLQPGDHVVIGLMVWCGVCSFCMSGESWLCASKLRYDAMFGLSADGSLRVRDANGVGLHTFMGVGTLAEYCLAPARQLVRVDPNLPLDLLCLIGCGVTTGVGAVVNTAKVQPGDAVVVLGCGGVGLSAVQGARICGAQTIVAVDRVPRKLELAKQLGATHCLDGDSDDVRARVLEITGRGADFAFEAVGLPGLVALAVDVLRPGGTAVAIGISPPGTVFPITREALMFERRLMTSMGGSSVPGAAIPKLVNLFVSGQLRLDEMVDQRLPLDRVDEAFAALETGSLARSVVVFPN